MVPLVSQIDGSKAFRNHLKRFFLISCLVSVRELASFVGEIISAGAVFGNSSRIMTKYCPITVASAQDWDSKFHLDQYCLEMSVVKVPRGESFQLSSSLSSHSYLFLRALM